MARVERRVRRARLRGEDVGRAVRRAGDRPGVALGPPTRGGHVALDAGAGTVVGRAGDDGRRPRVATARNADAGRRPAVDLRHIGQLDLVADRQLQRSRPGHRTGGRAGDRRRRRWRVLFRRDRRVPIAELGARRAGRLAARVRARGRRRLGRTDAAASRRRAHRLADRGRRRVRGQRGRVQLCVGDRAPLLRLVPGALDGDAGRRRGRRGAAARGGSPRFRSAGDRGRSWS